MMRLLLLIPSVSAYINKMRGEYESKLKNRNEYIKELNETIRGYKAENTRLKNELKNQQKQKV
jgi:prefoldin subunit 5